VTVGPVRPGDDRVNRPAIEASDRQRHRHSSHGYWPGSAPQYSSHCRFYTHTTIANETTWNKG